MTFLLGHWCSELGTLTFLLGHWCSELGTSTFLLGHWCSELGTSTFLLGHWCSELETPSSELRSHFFFSERCLRRATPTLLALHLSLESLQKLGFKVRSHF
ncbi:hypothetical protein [Nostoc sp.]|uniref:hypothetical protein n=1 Tax=Nostoc sp. TaxID=1180 RepID=UPI002FF9AD54